LCVFRVVQEALQNAIKYSKAREVAVHLVGSPDRLMLTVTDDGIGFDVDALWESGLGLVSMKERVEAAGGTLEIRSGPDSGTRVEATVPSQMVPHGDAILAELDSETSSPRDQSWV
jgi:signal transduction histidine kinase